MSEIYCNRCAKRLPENYMTLITKMYYPIEQQLVQLNAERALCNECQESFLNWFFKLK